MTISASCSIAPDSLKSPKRGLLSSLASAALFNCESANIGTFNSLVIFGSNGFIKKIKPPSIKVVNENGAGDALAAMMLYLFSINEKMNYILKTSVACGSYYASGKSLKTKSDFLKIKNLSKRVIVQ